MATVTAKQASAAIELIHAEMMAAFPDLAEYESMIGLMERTQLISRRGDLLIAARL